MKKILLCLSLFIFLNTIAYSNITSDTTSTEIELSEEQLEALYFQYADSIVQSFTYETSSVTLGNQLATIQIPEGYKYLNGEDSETVLTNLWGNPPSEDASLGMLIPLEDTPMSDSSYAINITYSEEGYVDDSDARKIDYDELLENMQSESDLINEQRVQMGYPAVQLVGWASPPFYDAESKKLHWAKELKFGDSPSNTLNYNIRILGRKGYLQLNAIGEMYVADEVKNKINYILPSVNFQEGNRYSDFNPDIDQVAAYGIGGLIAGKVLAKAGLFAKLGIFFAKFWKFIAIGAVALFAGIRNLLGRKEQEFPKTGVNQ